MKIFSAGKTIELPPRGPAGPDGNPIGTVISYMGVSAPKDYLICDGAIYSVSEYSDLAKFFQKQFGSTNYFGGDGTSTFAVPDMRNLFLRGYHGASEEQLSGEIGVKQDATEIVNLPVDENFVGWYGNNIHQNNVDAWSDERDNYRRVLHSATSSSSSTQPSAYTTRPVNMAVLYCIKAVESLPAEAVWSTEERRIGTWVDGKPIYRICIPYRVNTRAEQSHLDTGNFDTGLIDTLINTSGSCYAGRGDRLPIGSIYISVHLDLNRDLIFSQKYSSSTNFEYSGYVALEYTKTIDQATIELPAALTVSQPLYTAVPQSAASAELEGDFFNEEV